MTHDPSQTPEPNPTQSQPTDSAPNSTPDSTPIESASGQEPSHQEASNAAEAQSSESPSVEPQVVNEVQSLEENVLEEASVVEHGVVEHVTERAVESVESVESKSVPSEVAIDSAQVNPSTGEQAPTPSQTSSPTSTPSPAPQPSTTASPTATPPLEPSSKLQSFLRIVKQLGSILWTIWLAISPILLNLLRGLWQLLLYLLKGIRQGWNAILPRIRTVLPEGWNKLPDWAITTVAVSLLVLIVWITTLLLPGETPTVAQGDRSPSVTTPAQQPTEVSPDSTRIAKVQKQITDIAEPYSVGLVQAIRTNVRRNTITVKVSNDWYTLASDSQTRLANDLLKRSRKLDFNALEITDSEGDLIARSPVVGKTMVIYERVRNAALEESTANEPIPNEAATTELEQPEPISIPTAAF